jgi:hypothetical protein
MVMVVEEVVVAAAAAMAMVALPHVHTHNRAHPHPFLILVVVSPAASVTSNLRHPSLKAAARLPCHDGVAKTTLDPPTRSWVAGACSRYPVSLAHALL